MEERKIKFNFDEIQSVEGPKIDDPVPSFYNSSMEKSTAAPAPVSESAPVAPVEEPAAPIAQPVAPVEQPAAPVEQPAAPVEQPAAPVEQPVAPVAQPAAPVTQPVAPVEQPAAPVVQPAAPKYEEAAEEPKPVQPQQNVCIIDETATTVVIEQGPDIPAAELNPVRRAPVAPAPVPAAVKAEPKESIKFNIPQIILMAIVGLVAIWFIMFTVDHSFAVNATYPVFSKLEAEYADGSKSFKGLGYTVQFTYDENGNLSQSCNPFWKQGPNDGREDEV